MFASLDVRGVQIRLERALHVNRGSQLIPRTAPSVTRSSNIHRRASNAPMGVSAMGIPVLSVPVFVAPVPQGRQMTVSCVRLGGTS